MRRVNRFGEKGRRFEYIGGIMRFADTYKEAVAGYNEDVQKQIMKRERRIAELKLYLM